MSRLSRFSRKVVVLAAVTAAVAATGAPASTAFGAAPAWSIAISAQPTIFKAGSEDLYFVSIVNTGGGAVSGTSAPIAIANTLPAGVTAKEIFGDNSGLLEESLHCELATLKCLYSGVVTPGDVLVIRIVVNVAAQAGPTAESAVSVSGGGAASAFAHAATSVSSGSSPFGVTPGTFLFAPSTSQAGAHPNLTTNFMLNEEGIEEPVHSVQDTVVDLPPGFAGNATAAPLCDMERVVNNECPPDTAVGVVTVNPARIAVRPVLLYNVVPYKDEPAAFAFSQIFPGRIDTSVVKDAAGEYYIQARVTNISEQNAIMGATVTFWGVPADFNGEFGPGNELAPNTTFSNAGSTKHFGIPSASGRQAFMTNPTACGTPLSAGLSAISWPWLTQAGTLLDPVEASATTTTGAITGCDSVTFEPSISVAPDEAQAGAPTGFNVDLHVPQNENPDGLASADLRKAVVTLPPGVSLSPAAADGLQACSEAQVALASQSPAGCPDASKIGAVEVQTPLLSKALHGGIYLASQGANPFGSLVAMYLVVEGSGVVLKLAGEVHADPASGQLTTSFFNNPQLPFSDLRLHFDNGSRAPLANPAACGPATSNASLTPWSGGAAATPSSTYAVEGCQPAQFKPALTGGTIDSQAGGFSPFWVTLARSDGDEPFGAVSVTTPPGLLGLLKSVPLCEDAQAQAGTCPAASLIGHTTVGAGPGATPLHIGGSVYLTGPYRGAPFGLSIVVPAVAGPFNLGNVVVRAAISIDPNTSQLTVTSDPLPTIVDGIPLDVKTITVIVDRQGFMFDPTNCAPLSLAGTLASTRGASAQLATHFQVVNCAGLPFKARFTAATQAKTSRAKGASLQVKIAYTAGGANIHSVAVTLPRQLPARLSTIQQACPDATFQANPASCPTGSLIGMGTASTPILAAPLTGPVYLVSHGGAAFPDIVIVLEGQGIRFDLTGNINISKQGITSSTFASVPDAPISSFNLVLPEGPHSGLAATGSLCAKPLHMPTTITAQNGLQIKQNTTITAVGCAVKRRARKK
ncbi:MAG TPA: hypothetical protein VID29_10155 [Solirubrobacteraceae bacterium]